MPRLLLLLPLLLSGCFNITTTRDADGTLRSVTYGGCPSGQHATAEGCYNPHVQHHLPY